MADPCYFQSLTLEGFRAYLHPKTFDLSKKRSLAIFAPNGLGKSSVIDAMEFLFSEHGTLERLGQRSLNNQAGPQALAHNGAQAVGIAPTVKFATVTGKTVTEGSRAASGNQRPIHAAASAMKGFFAADPIIRGHTLRAFVEGQLPEGRYGEVAGWLQLSPLVEVQKNLRLLRRDVKAAAESTAEKTRLDGVLRTETGHDVPQWDEAAVLAFINEKVVAPLDASVVFAALNIADPAMATLDVRAEAEEKQVGLAGLRQIRNAAAALWSETMPEDGGDPVIGGAIPKFEAELRALAKANTMEIEERDKAAGIVFRAVWRSAAPLFDDVAAAPERCPICETPIAETAAGGVGAIHLLIAAHLDDLKTYDDAKKALDLAEASASQAHHRLAARLPAMIEHLDGDEISGSKGQLIDYQTAVVAWPGQEAPNPAPVMALLAGITSDLDAQIADIKAKQGEHTWVKAKAKIERLLNLQDVIALALLIAEELEKLHEALNEQTKQISDAIREKVQSMLDTLQSPMNAIYREIQGAAAMPIRLELPREDDTNQQRLQLVVDFAENRSSVPPAGYLSDSQIHSVALALRLAAIGQFNQDAPLIVLDDIVTSYDADHRRAIGAMIAMMFTHCQILLVTHDERFFNHLKDQLAAKDWHFTRIIGLDPAYGPRFADHKVSDEMIEARWADGASAANEMRQAEEEWLLGIARGFGVKIRIRPIEKAYSYDRTELATAIGSFLNGVQMTPANVPGVNNKFIASLINGNVENFGSHFQDGPYGDGSIGDEKTRWEEFKTFRNQFSCSSCGRTKFQRPFPLNRPVCAHHGCEAQFAFTPPGVAAV
jgi:recombinational DNA repair ATPase RecF